MQETPYNLSDYLSLLRRRRIYLLTIVPAIILLAVFTAFALPPSYRSSSTILLEAASIPAEFAGARISSYADQQIELVSRRVLSQENLEPLVAEMDPYPNLTELTAADKARRLIADTVIERVDPITLRVVQESNAFSIHYHNEDPERAAAIAQKVADLFLGYNRRTRAEQASSTYDFLLAQSTQLEKRIVEVDEEIAQFKMRYGSALPEVQARNQGSAERANRDLVDIEGQIRVAEERKALLTVQLSKVNPMLGSTASNLQTELATLQGQLADARVRYTPEHPDIKRLERQIETLSATAAAQPGSTQAASNPEYLAIQSQINATDREVAALQAMASRARGQIYEFESSLRSAPAVEQQYVELVRNRDILQGQFKDIQGKLREADIARNIETEQRGERFSQIRAPEVPGSPFFPNRSGLILLGIVLGIAIAVAIAVLVESSDASLRSTRDLAAITEMPVIATVPVILNAKGRRSRRLWWVSYATALVLATALVAGTVVMA